MVLTCKFAHGLS